jgi:tetratricopeptide (TPR) repeat protein
MPDIGNYTETTKLVLAEAGKYFALLLFAVLSIRLWRRWAKTSAADKSSSLLLATAVTLIAAAIGYFSMCQSLGRLYSYYGMEAFRAGRLPQALSLFESSAKFWNGPDALGRKGVCLLMSEDSGQGLPLIEEAKARRKGTGTSFENFYEGLYYFNQGQRTNGVPLLEAASADQTYHWSVVKLFAVMELDGNHPDDAATLMKPFMAAEITEDDQAYIIASLKLADGEKTEAQAILNKFPQGDPSPMWKSRFEKLQARINN